jgi:hypothetical protein
MAFTIEHEYPQCGAPVELEETNHLLRCPYCEVKIFLFTSGYFRFVLPHKTPDKDILYAPYMRFRVNVYLCEDTSISHRVVDITRLGATFEELPISLGLKPQAVKIKFVTPDVSGSFLKCFLKTDDVLGEVGRHASILGSGKIFHRAYIGEALSLIYLPMFVQKKKIFDAVTNQPITNLPENEDIFAPAIDDNSRWQLTIMATICPNCGWDLDGEGDSVVLICSNYDTAWEALDGKFVEVDFRMVPGSGKNTVYLPFWKIAARAKGLEINSYADFIRVTNQPKAIQRDWENQDMFFWIPAFKIRPRIFLDLSRQMTVTQKDFDMVKEIPKKNLYPVTLPQSEAVQSMKVTLAGSAMRKKKIFSLLPQVSFNTGESILVYLPFNDTGHAMVQEQMRISIHKKTLEFGRRL